MAIDQWFGFKITWKQPFDIHISCVFVVIKIKNSDLRLGAILPLREPHTQSYARRANIFFPVFTDFFCYSRDGLRGKEETIRSVQRVVNSLTCHRRQPKPTTSRAWKIAKLPFRFWSQFQWDVSRANSEKQASVGRQHSLCAQNRNPICPILQLEFDQYKGNGWEDFNIIKMGQWYRHLSSRRSVK